MTKLQSLTRSLLAAGFAKSQDGKEQYLLYVDSRQSFLQCHQWSGNSFGKQELIASSVRPNSTAAFLITPIGKLVICVSPSSSLDAYRYDPEEREWDESDEIPPNVVHPDGKLASSLDTRGRLHTVYQDPSGKLVYLDNSWSNTSLNVSPMLGSPLSISAIGDTLHIFYVSARDNFIHDATATNGKWNDRIVVKHKFGKNLKNFMMVETESREKEVYVLTVDDKLLKIDAENQLMKLGTVQMGKFVSERSVDHCAKDAWNGTLTEDSLKSYLKNDPCCIDIPGSDHAVTPLAAACIRGHLDVVRLLLRHGANPDALSPQRRTPLFYATSTPEGRDRHPIVRALLEAGANVDECYADNGFITPLMNAITLIADQDVVEELLRHGASPSAKDLAGHTVEDLSKGTPMEVLVSERVEQGDSTPLERQIVEVMVALLMFFIAYMNSPRVKNVADQIISRLKEGLDRNKGERTSTIPVPLNNPAAASMAVVKL